LRMCSDFLYQLRSHRRHFVKFMLCLCLFPCVNTFKTIQRAAYCEIRSVIRFLNARNVLPSEIHHQICQVYGENAMSDGMVRKWVRMFNEGRVISARLRELYLTKQNTHKRQTTKRLTKLDPIFPKSDEAPNPRLRPRGHWNWLCYCYIL